MEKLNVWQMIKEAVYNLNRPVSYSDIKEYINKKWANVNQATVTAQIIVLSVNHSSRIHYPPNHKPRLTNSNSPYDLLFKTKRGRVVKYNPDTHGIWEIFKNHGDKPAIRQFRDEITNKIFTPTDIVWFKNVTNNAMGEAYLQLTEDSFIIHFPKKLKTNASSPKVNEIILVYQKIDKVKAFTHLVTPVDDVVIEDHTRPNYCYGRRVKVIAKTDSNNFIHVSSTLFKNINLSGIIQGNVCKLENVSNIGNIAEMQLNIWQKFAEYFISSERQSMETTSEIIEELKITNPEISVAEGKLRLIDHIVKERNHKIVREKKQQAINSKTLNCEVCTFSFQKVYQTNYIECHHLSPISIGGVRETKLEDLALVCANCHRMLHTKFDGCFLSIEELRERLKICKRM